MENANLIGVTTALGVNIELHTNLVLWYQSQLNIAKIYVFLPSTEFCVFATPTFKESGPTRIGSSPSFN